jgi:hypothetical protein
MRARAIAFAWLGSCAGTLGSIDHRAPPGLAYCEPSAIRVDTLDARGAVARTTTARCRPDGAVLVSDSAGLILRRAGDDVAEAWSIAAAAPLTDCAPAPGPRYRITVTGDDAIDTATCALGADARFDAVLGAVMGIRHPAPTSWTDIVVVSTRSSASRRTPGPGR